MRNFSLPAFALLLLSALSATAVSAATNVAPVIRGTPASSAVAGTRYTFRPTATDANGDRLRFYMSNRPSWGTFNSYSGEFTGTPPAGMNQTFSNIVVSVSDGRRWASLPAFSIRVTSTTTNAAPTISGNPPTSVATSGAYSFRPTASDPNGDTLTFSITNKPSWATFSSTTGQLSGTAPSSATTTASIVIRVSDGRLSAALPAFTIRVNATATTNTAPTISGQPATSVLSSAAYSFRPTAADANGDALSFSIQNKPSWATFSIANGQLSGTAPATASTTSGIVISVSDGRLTTALPAFSISVNAPTSGSASLQWTAPTRNTDGSALTNLGGYRIYFGSSPSSLTQTQQIASTSTTSHVLNNLSAGTWYFAVAAYNTAGVESAKSGVGSKTIR
jgi:hypothetical protein